MAKENRLATFFQDYLFGKILDWVIIYMLQGPWISVPSLISLGIAWLTTDSFGRSLVVGGITLAVLMVLRRFIFRVKIDAEVDEIAEHFAARKKVLTVEARPSDTGPSHRIRLRVLNRGMSGDHFVQVVSMRGFNTSPATPWDVRWRDRPNELDIPIEIGQERLLDLAEADYMDWPNRDNGMTFREGAIYFLRPTDERERAVLGDNATTSAEFKDWDRDHQVPIGEVIVRVGRRGGPARCGTLRIWFTPDPPKISGTYDAEAVGMRPEIEWAWTTKCP